MKSTSLFFILLLIGSPLGVTQIDSVESEKNVDIFEEVVLGTNTQKNGFVDKVINIDESLILKNLEKFTKNTNSNQFLQERITISERTSPSTRLRNNIDSEIFGSKKKVSIPDYIQVITDYFYDGHTQTPQLPEITDRLEKINEVSIQELIFFEGKIKQESERQNKLDTINSTTISLSKEQISSHLVNTKLDNFENKNIENFDFTESKNRKTCRKTPKKYKKEERNGIYKQ
jgi:hypothetical protein